MFEPNEIRCRDFEKLRQSAMRGEKPEQITSYVDKILLRLKIVYIFFGYVLLSSVWELRSTVEDLMPNLLRSHCLFAYIPNPV